MEKSKNYKIYIIRCIVLLIIVSGTGIILFYQNLEKNKHSVVSSYEKPNEITEKIVYKILKNNNGYNDYYSLEKENKENSEEIGEYICESKECKFFPVTNNQPKFVIYDNGYKFLALEDNKINVQKIEELDKDNIDYIYIENNDLIVEYKNNSVGIYEVEPNQLKKLLLGNYTFNRIINNNVILIKGENFVIYDLKEKKVENEIYGPHSYFDMAENDKNTIYIL